MSQVTDKTTDMLQVTDKTTDMSQVTDKLYLSHNVVSSTLLKFKLCKIRHLVLH
jgi:hypothetical protein